jgi:hypothetical protein
LASIVKWKSNAVESVTDEMNSDSPDVHETTCSQEVIGCPGVQGMVKVKAVNNFVNATFDVPLSAEAPFILGVANPVWDGKVAVHSHVDVHDGSGIDASISDPKGTLLQ